MQYIVVIIQTAADGTVVPAAHRYATLAEAQSAYYAELSAGAISKSLQRDVCLLLDSEGSAYGSTSVKGLAEPARP